MSFKVGNKVRCIDDNCAAHILKKGKTYIITKISDTGSLGFKHTEGWFPERFEKVSPNPRRR